jgi:streptogramin lyase
VTQNGGVVKIDPATPTQGTATAIAAITDARIIVRGPDGNLWTASADKVIKIPPNNPAGYTAYNNTGVMGARAIAAAGDGTLWVADFGGQQLVNVTTAGAGTPYPLGGGPQGVWGGPGNQIAFADPGTNPQTIGRLVPGGTPQKRQTPDRDPFGVTFGGDNAYWIAQFANNRLGRLTPQGAYSQLGGFTGNAGPRQITTGPNNTLWVTLDGTDKIGRITGVKAEAPQTTITKKPKDTVRKKAGKKRSVTFRFKSNTPGSTFQCRLAKKGKSGAKWRSCTSPKTYKLGKGKYTFKVRARANGLTDTSPAVDKFKVVKPKRS